MKGADLKSIWLPDWLETPSSPSRDVELDEALIRFAAACEKKGVHVGFAAYADEVKILPEDWKWA